MLSAILFDLDGTMVNSDPLHFSTWQEVLLEFEITIDRAFYHQYISGRQNSEIVRDILPQLPFEEAFKVAEAKEARFRQLGDRLQPMAGLLNLLDWLRGQQIELAVVTNAPRANARFMLEALGLTSFFSTVVIAEEAARGKPDPEPYFLALKRLNVNSNDAIAFEDSPSGIISATGAGLYTIGIASTHDPQHLIDLGAKIAIADFTDSRLWEIFNGGSQASDR